MPQVWSREEATFPFFAVSTGSALPWGSSQPRATLCPEGRKRTGRKSCIAYSASESESVKTTKGETAAGIHRTIFKLRGRRNTLRAIPSPAGP